LGFTRLRVFETKKKSRTGFFLFGENDRSASRSTPTLPTEQHGGRQSRHSIAKNFVTHCTEINWPIRDIQSRLDDESLDQKKKSFAVENLFNFKYYHISTPEDHKTKFGVNRS
jgi:hypothetical protein